MGAARDLEKRLEGLVEGFFSKMFRSGLQPVEVGRRIVREMDEGRTISVNRTYAPNDFHVRMGPDDYERFQKMEAGLQREFSDLVIDHAKQNRWNLMGMPRISFAEVPEMKIGQYQVEASLAADPDARGPAVSTREPRQEDVSSTRAISSDTAGRLGVRSKQAQLAVLDEAGNETEHISITKEPVTIGRLSSSDVVLSDPNVSRRHAELRRNGDDWVLVDLGSTNGTTVNGKLAREHRLATGDRLAFGTSELIFKTGES